MKKYGVYMLMGNNKAVRYCKELMTKADAISAMRKGWGEAHKTKACKAMYVANLNNGTIVEMAM